LLPLFEKSSIDGTGRLNIGLEEAGSRSQSHSSHLQIIIDDQKAEPLYQQIVSSLRHSINQGSLEPGTVLPSTRVLAARLGVSRRTVIYSYQILQAQGYLDVSANNTIISLTTVPCPSTSSDHQFERKAGRELVLSDFGKRLPNSRVDSTFSSECAAPEDIPIDRWKRYLLSHLNRKNVILKPDCHPFGYAPLRDAIADYVSRVHGVNCGAEQVVIFPGLYTAIELVSRLLLNPGDKVVIENPGNISARQIFSTYGAQLVPISIDQDGMCAQDLETLQDEVKLVYITPSHHCPTGAVLPVARREALVAWAAKNNAIVVEDHTDSEYRYATRPCAALQALDTNDGVIYISTFEKVLFPLLRLGFAVVPKSIIPLVESARQLTNHDAPSLLEQCALADFINDGQLQRHIVKTGKIYAENRKALIIGLVRNFGQKVHIGKEGAGLHQYITLDLELTDEEIVQCANDANLSMARMAPYYLDGSSRGEFLISFARTTTTKLERNLRQFAGTVLRKSPMLDDLRIS
jgi:GntR family transcriptional regulator/MocR family aminotransferase